MCSIFVMRRWQLQCFWGLEGKYPPPCLSERGTWCVFIMSLRLPAPGEVSERFVGRPLPILRHPPRTVAWLFPNHFFVVFWTLFWIGFWSNLGTKSTPKINPKPTKKRSWNRPQENYVSDSILGRFFIDFSSIFKTTFEALDNHVSCLPAKGRKPIRFKKPMILRLRWHLCKTDTDTKI